jgi:hypothetical protein
MTRNLRMLAMAAALVLAAPAARAMDGVVLKVAIPFDFVVAGQHLPSGEYRVVKGQDAGVVRIYSKDQEHMVTAFCVPTRADLKEGGELVFQRRGQELFLKKIRTAEGYGAELLASPKDEAARPAPDAATVGMP